MLWEVLLKRFMNQNQWTVQPSKKYTSVTSVTHILLAIACWVFGVVGHLHRSNFVRCICCHCLLSLVGAAVAAEAPRYCSSSFVRCICCYCLLSLVVAAVAAAAPRYCSSHFVRYASNPEPLTPHPELNPKP